MIKHVLRFFVNYDPITAVDLLDSLMERIQWQQFKATKVEAVPDCWSLRAFINNSAGFYFQAIDSATNGLEVFADHMNSLFARGYAYAQIGEYYSAVTDLERALKLAKDMPRKEEQIQRLLDSVKRRREAMVTS